MSNGQIHHTEHHQGARAAQGADSAENPYWANGNGNGAAHANGHQPAPAPPGYGDPAAAYTAPAPPGYGDPVFHSQELINQAITYVEQANSMLLSGSVLVNREDMLNLLYQLREATPREVYYAQEMLRERNLYMAKIQRQANEIMETAAAQAAKRVEKTEIIKEAKRQAAQIVEDAQMRANRLRHDTFNYCETKLGRFETVLHKTMEEVRAGREKFNNDPLAKLNKKPEQKPKPATAPGFYDQEESQT